MSINRCENIFSGVHLPLNLGSLLDYTPNGVSGQL